MRPRTLLLVVLAAALGLVACAPANEADTVPLSEQAEEYVESIGSGPGYIGSGTFLVGARNPDGGSVTLGEINADVSAVRATCFGDGVVSVSFELHTADIVTTTAFDVPCDSAQHDAPLDQLFRSVTQARLQTAWLSGGDLAVVVSVVTPE
jgi:hypothetical protein